MTIDLRASALNVTGYPGNARASGFRNLRIVC